MPRRALGSFTLAVVVVIALLLLAADHFNAPKGIRLFYTRTDVNAQTAGQRNFNAPKGIRLFYTR